ncbi:MAG: RagB/SusD family nutrient uptake outer membrane protein [Bacteroidetes bacterium]|nr:RagB/SusD family nutrient uptake outer membrane protein [Bacteroidota bacterium]MBU1372766.1 RagB/SusD family nutrient uptake outer membrane protein [Bacteroidota bacterium]MBU1484962.1 RagB/SusD family nutrient uptake outer membrane protein [Bacteroidota bacterium]MBU1760916.1 RagB/SusD family nutrient uptake outer membrane protein [Bacteroidota bacterium]MBU2045827.1 RagB/SusD family nutrient uptake outer membrane protein [Bacteroidota bacterium]
MKIKNIIKTLVLSGVILVSSCKDDYLNQKPQAALDATTAYTDAASVKSGLLGIYGQTASSTSVTGGGFQNGNYYGLRYWALTDLYAGSITHTGTFPSFSSIANGLILADNAEVVNMWNSMYATINRANTLIAAIPNIKDGALNKDASLAEAKVIRALVYFDLLRLWGGSNSGYNKSGGVGVPIILQPTLVEADATPVARSTEAQVYTQINKDLDDAIAAASYSNKLTGRFGKDAAKAVKARVALYMGDYAMAETMASAVISSTSYALQPGATYSNIWLTQNTAESVFELQFDAQNSNGIAFFYYPTNRGGRNEINASAALNNAHETGDVRKPVNYAASPAKTTLKYTRISTGADDVTMIRIAEMYLIRAEARIKKSTPDIAGALSDVNKIRNRAGLADYVALLPSDILTQIIKEDRLEFAHEGHYWFDLRRNGLASSIVSEPFRALWPIPQREVLNSGGVITQNTGY